MSKPLVSILIPAYNAEKSVAQTIRSAMAQTWKRKEIIVVDDGSTDQTLAIARQFESGSVKIVASKNQGAAATRNLALQYSQGDFIQYLDADDLLAPDKIERQLAALHDNDGLRVLLSSSWGYFYHRAHRAQFVQNSLCRDLSPVEWLSRKMQENLHMQTATWLTSRELTDAAGPWNTSLASDDDGEYFCRVLLASDGTRFVPGTGVYYRVSGLGRLSYIGASDHKKDALLVSMKLYVAYLRSLEASEQTRTACLTYLQNWYGVFYPERPDLMAEVQTLAASLDGQMEVPRLRSKYAWIRPIFGWKAAKWAQNTLPNIKASCVRNWDKAMLRLETGRTERTLA